MQQFSPFYHYYFSYLGECVLYSTCLISEATLLNIREGIAYKLQTVQTVSNTAEISLFILRFCCRETVFYTLKKVFISDEFKANQYHNLIYMYKHVQCHYCTCNVIIADIAKLSDSTATYLNFSESNAQFTCKLCLR